MFKKIFKKFKVYFFSIFSSFLLFRTASANPIVPQGAKYQDGSYELNDLIEVGTTVAKFILGIVGSLALIMFVYGGVMMLISAGNSEKVGKAKNIIIAAVVGLVIVFFSYAIIVFVMKSLGVSWTGTTAPINTTTPPINTTTPSTN